MTSYLDRFVPTIILHSCSFVTICTESVSFCISDLLNKGSHSVICLDHMLLQDCMDSVPCFAVVKRPFSSFSRGNYFIMVIPWKALLCNIPHLDC